MKKLFIIISIFLLVSFVIGQTNPNVRYQNSYYKPSTGTYVQGHYKTEINKTNHDNFSTQGNYNYYTKATGTIPKDYSIQSSSYAKGKTIETGPKGGQYYINRNGNKTYVPKK